MMQTCVGELNASGTPEGNQKQMLPPLEIHTKTLLVLLLYIRISKKLHICYTTERQKPFTIAQKFFYCPVHDVYKWLDY